MCYVLQTGRRDLQKRGDVATGLGCCIDAASQALLASCMWQDVVRCAANADCKAPVKSCRWMRLVLYVYVCQDSVGGSVGCLQICGVAAMLRNIGQVCAVIRVGRALGYDGGSVANHRYDGVAAYRGLQHCNLYIATGAVICSNVGFYIHIFADLARYLQKSPIIDPKSVYLTGCSNV